MPKTHYEPPIEVCAECGREGEKGHEVVWCSSHRRWECLKVCFPKG